MVDNKEVAKTEAGTGLNVPNAVAKSNELNAIDSYEAALAFLGIESESDFTQLEWDTNPFDVVSKEQLVGIPHVILQWQFSSGNFGEFVICRALARLANGTDWLVLYTDGSLGVCQQLRELTDKRLEEKHPRPQQGANVRGGLVRSDYEVEVEGKVTSASTYYLTNSRKVA